MNLYEDIRAKVEASGFTWSAVCERADVSPSTATNWNSGNAKPNQSTYDKMNAALADMVRERDEAMKQAGLK